MKRFALLLALALAPGQLAAQGSALVGSWSVTMAVGMRVENGVETPITQTGTLDITTQGDSLIAIMTMPPREGAPPRAPSRMATAAATSPAVFVLRSEAKLRMNMEELTRTAISTFTLTASGDTLTGTMSRVIEGVDFPSTPQPVTGTRIKK